MGIIGERINKARREANLNQKELCQRAKITEGSLSRYENGIREPKSDAMIKLCKTLDISADYLLGITDVMTHKEADKNENEIFTILENTKAKLRQDGVMLSGKPASNEAVDCILMGIKMGVLLAIEEEKEKGKKLYSSY